VILCIFPEKEFNMSSINSDGINLKEVTVNAFYTAFSSTNEFDMESGLFNENRCIIMR